MKVRHGFDGTRMAEETRLDQFEREIVDNEQENEDRKKESIFDTFKISLIEFLNTSTAHGFARISNASSWISRITWMVIVLCLVSYLARAVYNLHLRLISHNINVIVKTKTVSALTLPAITVCDGIPHLASGKISQADTSNHTRTIMHAETEHMKNLIDKEKIHNETMSNFILKNEEGEMPLCQFSGELCTFDRHVKSQLPIIHKGQCYTFNQDGSLKQVLQGPTMGIFAVFYLANYANTTKSIGATSTHGIEIFIHKPNGGPLAGTDGILGIPGHLTRISVRQKIHQRLPEPYPDKCVNDNDNGSPHECQIKCISHHQEKQCNVISITIKHYFSDMNTEALGNMSSVPLPTTDGDHACIRKVMEQFANDQLSCNCNVPCYETAFEYSISQSRWPHDDIKNYILSVIKSQLGVNVTEKESNRQLAAIQVYYTQLQYEEILQLPAYSVDKFLSDLGGLLGLFIGASVFSGIEFLIFLLSSFINSIRVFLGRIRLFRFKKQTSK